MRKLVFIIFILLTGGLAWGGYQYYTQNKAAQPAAESVAEVVKGDIESVVTAQGKLEPKDYVDVGAQVSGLVEKLHPDIGDDVKQGDLIAEIDPDVYQSKVAGDEAQLKTLQAQKAEQEALVEQANQKLKRNQDLVKQNAISQEVLDDAQTNVNTALAKLKSLNAQIEQAQSALAGDKANLSYTKIYAPMDGTVVSQSVKEGQTINANQTAPVIVQVANLDTMTVRAQVAEADIMKLTPDMPVYFTTLGSKSRRWNGTIRQILPSPETVNDVVLYDVLVDVENKDHQLMTGMTTQMFFVLGEAKGVPIVPVSALRRRLPESDTQDGQAYEVRTIDHQKHTVIVGLSDRSKASIVSGLNIGDKILLSTPQGASSAAPGGGGRMRGGMGRL